MLAPAGLRAPWSLDHRVIGWLALPSQGTEASGFVPSGARSRILDRRSLQGWQQRLPSRLGTGALWLGGLGLIGPLKLAGLVVTGSLLAPCLLLLDRGRRQSEASAPVQPALLAAADLGLPRALQAADLGLEESQLFRARHASVCTVHHDASGRILQLELPAPLAPLPVPSSDAHPVG